MAVYAGHADCVSLLLRHAGADPNQVRAAARNLIGAAAFSLDALVTGGRDACTNADPVATRSQAASDGRPPLHIACQEGHHDVAMVLVHEGADPSLATEDGATPLILSASRGAAETVALLLRSGASTMGRCGGLTAAEWARQEGHTACADIIIGAFVQRGAAPPPQLVSKLLSLSEQSLDAIPFVSRGSAEVPLQPCFEMSVGSEASDSSTSPARKARAATYPASPS